MADTSKPAPLLRLSVALRREDRRTIREAAFRADVSTSEFIRRATLKAAKQTLKKAS